MYTEYSRTLLVQGRYTHDWVCARQARGCVRAACACACGCCDAMGLGMIADGRAREVVRMWHVNCGVPACGLERMELRREDELVGSLLLADVRGVGGLVEARVVGLPHGAWVSGAVGGGTPHRSASATWSCR